MAACSNEIDSKFSNFSPFLQLFAHEKASVIQALPEMESDKRTFFATPSFGAAFVSSLGDGMEEDEGPTNMDESDEVVRLPKPSK